MANPFKEAEKKNKKAPGSAQEPFVEKKEVEVVEASAEPEKPVETPKKPVVTVEEKKAVPKKPEKKVVDIFASLEAEKSTGKTYAFYLSEENAEKLKEKAAKMGISTSKLLDHILSQVL